MDPEMEKGLGGTPKDEWLGSETTIAATALERLQASREMHTKVLDYLKDRLKMSELAMSRFSSRWQVAEKKVQAYVPTEDYEETLKHLEMAKRDPEDPQYKGPIATNIVVPYAYATIMTIVTYHMQTFAGRRPMFSLGANSGTAEAARTGMETLLQWNADHERLVSALFQFLFDGQTYGLGVLRTAWKEEKKYRTIWTAGQKTRAEKTVFQGTAITAIDPFMFFPDPRVPMTQVGKNGEFCFFRSYMGMHSLLQMEDAGEGIRGVRDIKPMSVGSEDKITKSMRGMISLGEEVPGRETDPGKTITNFVRLDQGTCWVNPQELGLGPESKPELWLFTIANGNRVIQAERFDTDYDRHPVAVIEPYVQGYGFGQPSMADLVTPLQDVLSWFVNSHMRNVRSAINNMFVVDPSRVEVQDLRQGGPGKLIRLKRTAYGTDVKQALQQLAVTDVTRGHMGDLQLFMRMADSLTGVTDNLRGLQDAGGRKTATEIRTSSEAGASRLASQARLISAQGMTDLVEQMICNFQQNATDDFVGTVLGPTGPQSFRITPEQVTGDFYFPIMDGTLPLDRVAMLDIWKEIFMGVSQNQQLSAKYDAGQIFEYMTEISGVKNLSSFKRPPQAVPQNLIPASPEQIAGGAQSGRLQQLPPGLTGLPMR